MQIHELKNNTKRETRTRVGRGGKRGKTSGKGHKGQKSRSGGGGSPRPYIREDIKKIPKRRGYGKNRPRTVNSDRVLVQTISLNELKDVSLKTITPKSLLSIGLVKKHKGKIPLVKILGTGSVSNAYKIVGVALSDTARDKIEKAGGLIV